MFITVRELPPSQLESHTNGNTFETVAYMQSNNCDDVQIVFNYDFCVTKHKKILIGYHIKISNENIKKYVLNYRARKQQMLSGL